MHQPANTHSESFCHRRITLYLCMLAALLLLACAGKEGRAAAPVRGNTDAGPDDDAAMAMQPAPEEDSGVHVISSGGTELCTYEASDRLVLADHVQSGVLSSAASSKGFGVVHQREDGVLFLTAVGRSGAVDGAIALTSASSAASAPVLLTTDDKFLLAYRRANSLITRDLDDGDSLAQTLTDALLPAADGGQPWALASSKTGYVASWLQDESAPQLRIAALDTEGKLVDAPSTLPELAERASEGIALASMQNGSLMLVWRQPDADDKPAVFGQLVTSALSARGKPAQLSQTPASPGPIGLAARADSAGLLYPGLDGGARQALKLRRIAQTGKSDGPILNVADAPRVVYGGSIAAYGRGYVLVYRELPSLGQPLSAVRIAFINPFGTVVYDALIAEVSDTPAAVSVSAGDDEHLMVSFIDVGPEATKLHALRMACPGALVLCGGKLE